MDEFDHFDLFSQSDQSDHLFSLSPPPPPALELEMSPETHSIEVSPPETLLPEMLAPPPLAIYPSREVLFKAIQSWSKVRGYAFISGKSKRLESGRQKVYFACDRRAPVPPPAEPL